MLTAHSSSVTIENAGFGGLNGAALPTPPSQILWNFSTATKLLLQSVSFPGSILAPQAAASFQHGSVNGTVVVASAVVNAELDWTPYQVPSSVGCLPLDASWSCSNDTANDDTGHAAALSPEAGFLDIPSDNYAVAGVNRNSPEHRIWYSFQPAQIMPTTKPLAIFFNGGPGSATSSLLFSFNTANKTLDPAVTSTIAPNPQTWAQFANLLYIDAPATGFSYPLNPGNVVPPPDIGIDIDRDAGIFLSVITRFLLRHPALLGNQVILVGESYGGTRATLMLIYLYNYEIYNTTSTGINDSQVLGDLQSYFSTAFQTTTPNTTQISKIFGHQVLIEPAIVGATQNNQQYTDEVANPQPGCIASSNLSYPCSSSSGTIMATCDLDSCDMPVGWTDAQEATVAGKLTQVVNLKQALGVDPTTIEWMKASARIYAYGRDTGSVIQDNQTDMSNASNFGALQSPTDRYFVILNDEVNVGYSGAEDWEEAGGRVGDDFLLNVQAGVGTFITVAQYDQVIWSPAIPEALESLANPPPGSIGFQDIENLVSSVTYDGSHNTGLARSGRMSIVYKSPSATLYPAMPGKYLAGHVVTMGGHAIPAGATSGSAALLADVMNWY